MHQANITVAPNVVVASCNINIHSVLPISCSLWNVFEEDNDRCPMLAYRIGTVKVGLSKEKRTDV